jgi:hypothetical protein
LTALATDGVPAVLSPQKLYVDGRRTELLAYSIGDNNYIRIRDLGRTANFSVRYNADGDAVALDRKSAMPV